MNFSNSRRFKINLGNYESFEFSAQVTVNHGDVGYTDVEIQEGVRSEGDEYLDTVIAAMRERCDKTLDMLLIEDIRAAQGITEEQRSVVLRAFTSLEEPTPPTNRPASRRRPRRPANG